MINLAKNRKNTGGKIKTLPVCLALVFFAILTASCNRNRVIYTPRGYDITKPQGVQLGTKLDEISGICWVNDSTMLANNDESGRIYAIDLSDINSKDYNQLKFGGKDDYEDIVKVDSAIYLLVSPGRILKITGYQSRDSTRSELVADLGGKNNEFETLYYDPEVHSLIMVCKDCHKEKDKIRSAYRFDLVTSTLVDTPYYQIQMDQIRQIMGRAEVDFRPSAAALNPVDNKVYFVSSVGKLMVVTNKKGKVEQAFGISGLLFPQPEGITFAANGDMYISNEIASEPAATLLKFKYTQP
jgi:uncharacterized protein YjiK